MALPCLDQSFNSSNEPVLIRYHQILRIRSVYHRDGRQKASIAAISINVKRLKVG